MEITKELFALQDEEYADFQAKLTPGIPRECFIGVRVPKVRSLAKSYYKNPESKFFLQELPHRYYDENMLQGLLLSEEKDFHTCVKGVEAFLPYVDNWAVCDIMSPKVFGKHKEELLPVLWKWIASDKVYTCRFGIEMLMRHYLDKDYKPEYLEPVAAIRSEEYYVNMMIAWFFATALAKQWDTVIPYIEEKRLTPWVHKKTIQKARESYRITPEQKEYLWNCKKAKQ